MTSLVKTSCEQCVFHQLKDFIKHDKEITCGCKKPIVIENCDDSDIDDDELSMEINKNNSILKQNLKSTKKFSLICYQGNHDWFPIKYPPTNGKVFLFDFYQIKKLDLWINQKLFDGFFFDHYFSEFQKILNFVQTKIEYFL